MNINRTTKRTIDMLELISKNPKGLSLSEIANEMDIPKTSAYDILTTLTYMQMVELIDERSKIYALGVKTFAIGSKYIGGVELIKLARPYMEELGNKLSKTIFLGIRTNDKVIYLDKYCPKSEILTTCNIGSESGLHCTSLGKAILAFDKHYKKIIDQLDLYPKTSKTITDKESLYKEVEKIRQQGFAIDDREDREHMLCSGAPIFNHNGKIIAALSFTGLYVEGKDYNSEYMLLKEAANEISGKMGFANNIAL
jgi:DNA-binding IclR family transcriptional regulator